MGNKKLSAVINIGGAISSSLGAAFGRVIGETTKIGESIQKLTARERELNTMIERTGRSGKAGSELRIQYAKQELEVIGRQVTALRNRQRAEQAIADTRQKSQSDFIGRAASAVAIGSLVRQPLAAFEDLDAAMNNMEVAFMSGGGLPKQLAEIKRQTVELGNKLPGTTADFVNLATALKEQGTPLNAIVGGALKAAANLSVVLKMVPEQAGEMVAKLRESFALGEGEFAKMADYTQRARFAFGLKSDDLLIGAKYYGAKLNTLGITGAENVRKIFALQGAAAQQGMDGSTFGTNFAQMLTRLGTMTQRLQKNSKEMRAVNADLKAAGIHMEFFDKTGKFAGIDNMVAQLGKLGKLSQEKRLQVLFRLFGEEGSRPADLIARMGVAGFQKALAKADNEASLDKRIEKTLTSFKNINEALSGTVTNLMAVVGAPIAEMLGPILIKLNEITGGPLQDWAERNKTIIKTVGILAGVTSGVLAVGAALAGLSYVWTFVRAGLLLIGVASGPVIGAIAAVATAAALIYENWEPLKAFFVNLWDSIKATFTASYDWIVGKVAQVSGFFGVDASGAAGGAGPAAPAVPQMAARSGGIVNDHSQTTIHVVQQPGQDSKALAEDIIKQMRVRDGIRSRSMMFDGVGAQ